MSANSSKAEGAHHALDAVLTFTGAHIVRDACRHVPVARADIDENTLVTDPEFLAAARESLQLLTAAVSIDHADQM
ncbi:MAG: hypothetical protein GX542_10320 [Rhodococcus sp.]|nr:hypothetical protein [Rhodococcus sp. (in: high G+C Gram-positive bacteria)]